MLSRNIITFNWRRAFMFGAAATSSTAYALYDQDERESLRAKMRQIQAASMVKQMSGAAQNMPALAQLS